ncbi:enoyl-CoA hydratase [Calidifontibacillus erzurumensis]|uniref:Enoyl-CoA hydratase n=1 Tax=Calidifontibacillus erzurumensis TaxID=2741433 RepID=A0A8J8K863_9BACI|nr:enoyl-CoA hydratase [Calidifontibacillus erzurumensis]NSL51546.1 enoyl-CoA hydratase [Calidifontibacillus erzurumensis]
MNYFTVQIEEKVATIILNRPPANALASDVLKELSLVLDEVEKNEDVRVLLLKGEGRFFSAGADIKEFTEVDSEQGFKEIAERGQQLFNRIENFPKPVIAAIHGAALGGGLELAMACHIRLAGENAKLGLPELQLGIIPGFAGTQRLPRLVGVPKAAEMMFTSEPVTGKQAAALGLVNHAYPEEVLFEEAEKLARKIAAKSPISLRHTIELLQYAKGASFEKGVSQEASLFGKIFFTEDAKEGIQAFIEKRSPEFKGK